MDKKIGQVIVKAQVIVGKNVLRKTDDQKRGNERNQVYNTG